MNVRANAELGSDVELMNLVNKIRGFDFDEAGPAENLALARALKLITEDTLRRHDDVRQMQIRMRERLAVAETASELAGVVNALNQPDPPRKRGLWS